MSEAVISECLLSLYLEFTRGMAASKCQSFKFNISTTNFNFNFATKEERKPSTMVHQQKKKISPSTIRRKARRKE